MLRAIARSFRERLRTFELLYRMGGDEFLLVLPGADAATASDIADALRRAVDALRPAGLEVTLLVRHRHRRGRRGRLRALLARADAALYEAKRLGRDRVDLAAPRSPATAAGPAR